MNNTTPTQEQFKIAIDQMDYDTQFHYHLAQITDARMRVEYLDAYLSASQVEETARRNARKAAVIINMYGVQS